VRLARGIGAVAFALFSTGAADPLTVEVQYADAERFAAVFAASDGKPDASALQARYLAPASNGVRIFTPHRIVDAENLAAAVARDSQRYAYAIKTCLPLVRDVTSEMRATYLAFQGLLPERPLPEVHVVFGAGNSGGTADATAQVIGLEVVCGPGTTPEQFRQTMRSFFAHETVHTWQREPGARNQADPLLDYALREGVPDFLAALVTARIPDPKRNAWALEREASLWAEFGTDRKKVLLEKDEKVAWQTVTRWFANYGSAPEGWPNELGYWVGMRIAEAYVDQASDKRKAIRDLIELEDPQAILAASGYSPH
jgi:hypothetical protein